MASKLVSTLRHSLAYRRKPRFVDTLCRWTARRLLARVHHVVHRMPQTHRAPERGRIFIVAPHMDDETIGLGGTMAIHQDLGSDLGLVFTSDCAGVSPDPERNAAEARVRQAEAVAHQKFFGVDYLGHLDFPTGSLSSCEPAMTEKLVTVIGDWSPDAIFLPFPTDMHRDHQATSLATVRAVERLGWTGEMWGYEIWSTLWPNTIVDITGVIDRKRKALNIYKSQMADMNYEEASIGLNAYRGLRIGVRYGEAFHVDTAESFCSLARKLMEQI